MTRSILDHNLLKCLVLETVLFGYQCSAFPFAQNESWSVFENLLHHLIPEMCPSLDNKSHASRHCRTGGDVLIVGKLIDCQRSASAHEAMNIDVVTLKIGMFLGLWL